MRRWIVSQYQNIAAAGFVLVASILAGCMTRGVLTDKSPAMETRVYDIRDLIIHAPDFSEGGDFAHAPAFSLKGVGVRKPPVPPSSLPQLSEELWIISKPAAPVVDQEKMPRSGSLVVQEGEQILPFPLKQTDVQARIDGYIATVSVVQKYHNPFDKKIEAVYVFPLPENAGVNEFVMTVGDRTIRGIIRERKEAEKIYEEAKKQGYTASLLAQDRPNIFTQKVANIEPGKSIDINIRYFHTLAYVDGWYEFVFPMVVGPRFNPPMTAANSAVSGDPTVRSGQATEVSYLSSDMHSGNRVTVAVDLHAGVEIEQIESPQHEVDITRTDKQSAMVRIKPTDRIPNKDFILRYKVAGREMKSAVMAQKDGRGGGYFAIMLYPPETTNNLPRRPVDLCFLVDASGSMTGRPIEQTQDAMRAALKMMNETDTFNIMKFANKTFKFRDARIFATEGEKNRALRFIDNTKPDGGTMMLDGIKSALSQPVEPIRVRYVCLMTDGFVGNEKEIIQATRAMRGTTRVFGFGVGSSPNRFLLDGISRAGGGAVAYLGAADRADSVLQQFFERISHPVMTNIELDARGLKNASINPFKIPDLHVGRAVVLTGRYEGDGGSIVVRGIVNGETVARKFEIRPDSQGTSLASVWARQQIQSLCDQVMFDGASLQLDQAVKKIALEHNLLSDFTSFVAVDTLNRTEGENASTVVQPVPLPAGMSIESDPNQQTAPTPQPPPPSTNAVSETQDKDQITDTHSRDNHTSPGQPPTTSRSIPR